MNWWRALRNEPITTRLALPTDRAQVSTLLLSTWRHYGSQTLDDQATLLQSGLSSLAFARQEPVGFLGVTARAPAGSPPETWADVGLVAIASHQPVNEALAPLLRQALPALQEAGCTGLVCLTSADWLKEELLRMGFTESDQVISYVQDDLRRLSALVERAQLRPASAHDTGTILALNAAAFAPLWRYGDATVISWVMASERAVLAYLQDEPVGFALTANSVAGSYAHLIRVALHPSAQGRGIGRQLVADSLHHAHESGAPGLALNTQASNIVSRRLYESLGFRPVDPVMSVLVYAI